MLKLACVQTTPLPQKKIGRRDDFFSPDFFLGRGGRLYTGNSKVGRPVRLKCRKKLQWLLSWLISYSSSVLNYYIIDNEKEIKAIEFINKQMFSPNMSCRKMRPIQLKHLQNSRTRKKNYAHRSLLFNL